MDKIEQVVNALLALLGRIADAVLAGLSQLEGWLRDQLTQIGIAPPVQTAIMLAVAILLLLLVLRLFGGVIRVVLVLFLILLALHVVLPLAHA